MASYENLRCILRGSSAWVVTWGPEGAATFGTMEDGQPSRRPVRWWHCHPSIADVPGYRRVLEHTPRIESRQSRHVRSNRWSQSAPAFERLSLEAGSTEAPKMLLTGELAGRQAGSAGCLRLPLARHLAGSYIRNRGILLAMARWICTEPRNQALGIKERRDSLLEVVLEVAVETCHELGWRRTIACWLFQRAHPN